MLMIIRLLRRIHLILELMLVIICLLLRIHVEVRLADRIGDRVYARHAADRDREAQLRIIRDTDVLDGL